MHRWRTSGALLVLHNVCKAQSVHSFACVSSIHYTGSAQDEAVIIINLFILSLHVTLRILRTSKLVPMVRDGNAVDRLCREKRSRRMQMRGCIHSLSESSLSSFLHSSFLAPVSDRLFFHSGPGGRRAYRSTLSAEGKGMWATPILWAVSKQPLCNLWLGEVVHGEGAVCLSSVGLHKYVFLIRVGGHVWLHGHNVLPHSYTFGRRTLAFCTVCTATLNQSVFFRQNVSYQTFFHVLPALQ